MRGLVLQAHDGSEIPNSIDPDPSPRVVELAFQAMDPLVKRRAEQLSPPTGRYNCHGLVFASRRTNIPPPDVDVDIDDLLRRDGYSRVSEPRVGDVAAYRDSSSEIEHTGFVHRIDKVGSHLVVFVWSMWGSLGEFVHPADISPYSQHVEYWRIRL